jgi:hypothetical protein
LRKSRGVYNIIERRCDLLERQREQHKGDPLVRQDKAFNVGADREDEHEKMGIKNTKRSLYINAFDLLSASQRLSRWLMVVDEEFVGSKRMKRSPWRFRMELRERTWTCLAMMWPHISGTNTIMTVGN